jgi:hypothetical protein
MDNVNKTPLPEPTPYDGDKWVSPGPQRRYTEVIPNPGWFHGYGVTGTTHGTWHPYDTHIPLVVVWLAYTSLEKPIRSVNMTDISATLSCACCIYKCLMAV